MMLLSRGVACVGRRIYLVLEVAVLPALAGTFASVDCVPLGPQHAFLVEAVALLFILTSC